jgi:hypothetical protein
MHTGPSGSTWHGQALSATVSEHTSGRAFYLNTYATHHRSCHAPPPQLASRHVRLTRRLCYQMRLAPSWPSYGFTTCSVGSLVKKPAVPRLPTLSSLLCPALSAVVSEHTSGWAVYHLDQCANSHLGDPTSVSFNLIPAALPICRLCYQMRLAPSDGPP